MFQTPDLMGSRNTHNSRCFFLTKHKIRDSAKSTLCEYVAVVYTSIQNSCTTYINLKQCTGFCGNKQSFKMFTDVIPTMYIEAQKEEF
jgi:hypothetical protein